MIRQIVLKYETEYNGKILTKESNEEEFTPQTIATEQKERIKAQTVEEVYKAAYTERGNLYAGLYCRLFAGRNGVCDMQGTRNGLWVGVGAGLTIMIVSGCFSDQ